MAALKGGARPGAGRKKGVYAGNEPRELISISLTKTEIQELDGLVESVKAALPEEKRAGVNRSTIIRTALANQWLFAMTPEQLAALRTLAGAAHGD